MLEISQSCQIDDDTDWAQRSEVWIKDSAASAPFRRKKRERNPTPLILCGHGISLRVESGALVVRDGFTHYPQEQNVHRFFPRDLELPTRIVLLDGSGTLSFEVLNWLTDQNVALARVKWTGEVATVAGGNGYAADPAKLEWQKETRGNPKKRLSFAADLIRQKVLASLDTIERFIPEGRGRERACEKACAAVDRLCHETFTDLNVIFALEGDCASAYFASWHGLPVQWTGLARRPVPIDWHCYSGRSSLAVGIKPENRNASHPINAMLNYAYAVKLSQLQIDTIAKGYDPILGIMHNTHKGTPALVLDFIELERPRVDAKILELVATRKFAAADFIVKRDGVCRLSPQLARVVAGVALQK
jgi:CRISPR-associated protein Cas1